MCVVSWRGIHCSHEVGKCIVGVRRSIHVAIFLANVDRREKSRGERQKTKKRVALKHRYPPLSPNKRLDETIVSGVWLWIDETHIALWENTCLCSVALREVYFWESRGLYRVRDMQIRTRLPWGSTKHWIDVCDNICIRIHLKRRCFGLCLRRVQRRFCQFSTTYFNPLSNRVKKRRNLRHQKL